MAVRSARLGTGNSNPSGSDKTIYTCPSGVTALVKDIRVNYASGTVSRGYIRLQSGGDSVIVIDRAFAAGDTASVQGFMVLEPGDQVLIFASGGALQVWVSGAELAGLAP